MRPLHNPIFRDIEKKMTDLKKIPIGNREGNDLSACLPERVRLQSGNAQAGMRGLVSSRGKKRFQQKT